MKKHYNVVIAGASGIAEAVGLLLMERSGSYPFYFIGELHSKALKVTKWIEEGTTKPSVVKSFHLTKNGLLTDEMKDIFMQSDMLLDCLPGSQAPKMAQFAKDFHILKTIKSFCMLL